MGLFNRIKTNLTAKNEKDLTFGISKVREFQNAYRQSNYAVAQQIFEDLSDRERSIVFSGFSSEELKRWLAVDPENWLALLMAGLGFLRSGGEIRAAAWAEEVSEDQFEGFYEHLQIAESYLLKSLDHNPNSAATFSVLLSLYLGFEAKDEAIHCFEKAREIAPGHIGAHLGLANVLAPKWLGSWEELDSFTDYAVNQSEYPALRIVFLQYLIEKYIEDQPIHSYKNQVVKLYETCDFQSIEHVGRTFLRNYFAAIFYLLGDKKRFSAEIDKIGKNISDSPWAHFGVTGTKDLQLMKHSM